MIVTRNMNICSSFMSNLDKSRKFSVDFTYIYNCCIGGESYLIWIKIHDSKYNYTIF